MGGKNAKQNAQTGQQNGYWPYANLFSNHNGYGLAPFFGGMGGYGGLGGYGGYGGLGGYGGYGGCGGGISPLAFPFGGNHFGGVPMLGFPGFGAQGLPATTKGKLNLIDNFSGAKMNLRKPFFPPKESVATPERPLLEEDFPSPDTASTTSHIYMEVTDPPHQSRSKWHQSGQDLSLQPIHRPLQQTLVDSSASSQSSGYGSSASPHFQDGQRHLMPSNQNTFHYDNVRGEMRGPFVRFQPEGGIATLSGHHGPRIHYPGQSEAFMSQSLHAGSGLGLGAVHRTPTVLDENKSGEVFLHDSQFV